MSKTVRIPFLPIFKDTMLSGIKTCTSRTRRYGQPGDKFEAWGEIFEIREIERLLLSTVRDKFYRHEGFTSPDEFVAVWTKLHPIKGFDPESAVYLHSFRKELRNES